MKNTMKLDAKVLILLLIPLFFFSSCKPPVKFEKIEGFKFNIENKHLQGILKLRISNSGMFSVDLSDGDFDLWINDMLIGKVKSDTFLHTQAHSEEVYEVPVKLEIKDWFTTGAALISVLTKNSFEVRIKGNVKAKYLLFTQNIEFDASQDIIND